MKKRVIVVLCFIMFMVGWFANEVFQSENANAARTVEYKVAIDLPMLYNANTEKSKKKLERELNKYGNEGWEVVHFENGGKAVFKR